jgi:hypothetical protein
MSIFLSHREALDRARRAGCLGAGLYGPPDLVIGIRRGGLAVAMAFAHGAGAARTAFVTRRAGTRPGTLATMSRCGRQLVPRRLRQLGKSLLYRRYGAADEAAAAWHRVGALHRRTRTVA